MSKISEYAITSGNIGGLITYLDMLSAKGRVPASTVTTLKSATKAVFTQVDGDDWQNIDVRKLDLDDYMARFQNITNGKYDIKSYDTYKARVNRALGWYLKVLQTPGWYPTVKPPRTERKTTIKTTTSTAILGQEAAEGIIVERDARDMPTPVIPASTTETSLLVDFPFPLSDNTLVTLRLPCSLKPADAKRLQKFIDTLVIEDNNESEG